MQWGWQWRWRVKSREPTQVPFPHKMTWVASFFQVLRKKSEATILQPEIKVTRLWGAGDATQNGWIFGKVLKGGGHFQSKNLCCRFCTFKQAFFWTLSEENCNIFFWKWGGGVTCCLEIFRKIIHFGRVTRPWEWQVSSHCLEPLCCVTINGSIDYTISLSNAGRIIALLCTVSHSLTPVQTLVWRFWL